MNESSASCRLAFGRTRASSGVRLAALRGGSVAAICRSLVCKALPGVFVSIGVFAVAESPLGAAAGRTNAPHVHVALYAAPESVPLTEVRPRFRPQSAAISEPAILSTSHETWSSGSAAYSLAQAAIEKTRSLLDARSHAYISAIDLHGGLAFSADAANGANVASQSEALITSGSFSKASVQSVPALIDKIAFPRIVLDVSALSFEWLPRGLSDMALDPVPGAAGRLDPVIDYVTVALDDVGAELQANWNAGQAIRDNVLSGAAAALRTGEATALSFGANRDKEASRGGQPVPGAPDGGIARYTVALRPQDIDTASPLMEPIGLVGLGAAMARPTGQSDSSQSVTWPHGDKTEPNDLPQHTPLPSATAQAPFVAMISGAKAGDEASFPNNLHTLDGNSPEDATGWTGLPGETVQVSDGFSYNDAFEAPTLLRLGTLVDILADRFEPEELERLKNSSALDAYLPMSELQAAGIPVGHDLTSNQLSINLAAAQSAPIGLGGSSNNVSTEGGSKFSGWRQSLTASASAGFDSNPFLAETGNPEAASIRVLITPTLSRSGERSTIRLSGRAEHIEYLEQYDSLQNFGADLAASRRVSERLEIDGGLTFRSDILATNLANPFANGDAGLDPALPPQGNDVTILGQGQRRTQYGGSAGLTYVLSERDQLSWSLSARADRFGSDGLIDSNFFAQQFQYSRRIDEGLTIGAAIDASLIDFTGGGLEGARTLSPQLQGTAALTPRIELSGSIGLAITRLDFGGLEETTTALAGSVSLCNSGDRSRICLNGSRQVLPAAIGGALLQTTAGLSYSLRLSERDTLQLSGNYATASQPLDGPLGDFESINGFARYERQLDERLRLFVSAGALNTSGNRPTDLTNYQGLVGITVALGKSQ